MDCNVDNCEKKATHRYRWAWGEEGACCDEHRALFESKAGQLGREITFVGVDAPREYRTPTLERLDPATGKLKLENAELHEKLKSANARIGELEVKVYELAAQLDEARAGREPETTAKG